MFNYVLYKEIISKFVFSIALQCHILNSSTEKNSRRYGKNSVKDPALMFIFCVPASGPQNYKWQNRKLRCIHRLHLKVALPRHNEECFSRRELRSRQWCVMAWRGGGGAGRTVLAQPPRYHCHFKHIWIFFLQWLLRYKKFSFFLIFNIVDLLFIRFLSKFLSW